MPLTVSAISKRFSNNWALRDVSFEAGAGEIIGICGPAGSGKSVLTKIIADKLAPDGGKSVFSFDGHPNGDGITPLFHATDEPRQTGFFSRLFGSVARIGSSPDRDLQLVDEAINSSAKLIIFDEVFEHIGTNEAHKQFGRLRRAFLAKGKTGVFTSERFERLAELCDRIAILADGQIIQLGTPESLYNLPDDARVAALTGRINLIEARRLSSSKEDRPEFQTIIGSHRIRAEKPPGRRLGPLNRNIQLGIRPEHISIAFCASFPEDNILKAVLEDIRFCGPETFVECNAGDLALTVSVRRLVGLEIGSECVLGLPTDRIMLL